MLVRRERSVRGVMLILVSVVAACSPSADPGTANGGQNAAVGTPLPIPVAEPKSERLLASSPAAAEARAVVERYFQLIEKQHYAHARSLWGNGGADYRGSVAQFADSFRVFTRYEPEVGAPTAIKESNGMQYISVAATTHVTLRKTGREQDRAGPVLLKRSADLSETADDKKNWRIWGTDLRVAH